MAILSAVFYFMGYHPFLTMVGLILGGLILCAALAKLLHQPAWYALMLIVFILAQINFFTGHIWNALFLN
jgi:hypothetical protein